LFRYLLFLIIVFFTNINNLLQNGAPGIMRQKSFSMLAMALVAALFYGCNKENPVSPSNTKTGKEALLIVIENNNSIDPLMSSGYTYFQTEIKTILADVFQIRPQDIPDNLSLDEVIDQFGEDWQIDELTKTAQPFYSKIISLTDDAATEIAVLDSLTILCRSGYTVDMIFNLHGGLNIFNGGASVWFADQFYNLNAFVDSIISRSVCPRALYQTCCYGSYMIETWERAGIYAVNGANEQNTFSMFSPIYFLRNWTEGMSFSQAVQAAFDQEYKKIESYSNVLEEITQLLSEEALEGSRQEIGGKDTLLLWKSSEQ